MHTFTITATELKNNTAEILDKVAYANKKALITKHGTIIAELKPVTTGKKLSINDLVGILPNFPKVKKFRSKNTSRFKLKI